MFCLAMVLFVASVPIPFLTCTWPGMELQNVGFIIQNPLPFQTEFSRQLTRSLCFQTKRVTLGQESMSSAAICRRVGTLQIPCSAKKDSKRAQRREEINRQGTRYLCSLNYSSLCLYRALLSVASYPRSMGIKSLKVRISLRRTLVVSQERPW